MGLTYVTVSVRAPGASSRAYESGFAVDTSATDSMVPGSELTKIGIQPVGRTTYELADRTLHEYPLASHRSSSWEKSRQVA
jgi:hypothetical protein